jgi:hypothetical protein
MNTIKKEMELFEKKAALAEKIFISSVSTGKAMFPIHAFSAAADFMRTAAEYEKEAIANAQEKIANV